MGSRPLPPSLPKSPFPRPSPQVTPAAPGVRQGHAETFVQTALHLTTGRSGCRSMRGAPQAPGTVGPAAGKGGGAKRPLNFLSAWSYVCRTAMSTTATWQDGPFRLEVLGAVSPAREADCVTRGLRHSRGVWSHHGAVVLGQRVSRAPVFSQQSSDSRGGGSLVSKALPHRDFFLRPEKPRFSYS